MAKLPFRGIAQIATAQPPPASTPVAAPDSRPATPADPPPPIRPLGYSAEQDDAMPPGSALARWWAALKRVLFDPPR